MSNNSIDNNGYKFSEKCIHFLESKGWDKKYTYMFIAYNPHAYIFVERQKILSAKIDDIIEVFTHYITKHSVQSIEDSNYKHISSANILIDYIGLLSVFGFEDIDQACIKCGERGHIMHLMLNVVFINIENK